MIKLSLTIFFLFGLVVSYGQTHNELNKDTTHFKNAPLYILQPPLTNQIEASGIVIKPEDIESINVRKDIASVEEYGQKAKNGVIILKTKKVLKIKILSELLEGFRITNKNLPVFIDSTIANKPATYYFDPEVIKSAGIKKELSTGMEYISIISIYPTHHPKQDKAHIKGKVSDIKVN
ncbi:hypothetical protein [Mucilaginibacter sp.]|uniref:hypothetical protein n=1 Tax=Mucilaginibacter sp. TaxID=1882438 RepID=UPI0025CC63BF|nr:hypothetical protein [Mucilaginibacter sp.]